MKLSKGLISFEFRMVNGTVECCRIERNSCRVISRRFIPLISIISMLALVTKLIDEGYEPSEDIKAHHSAFNEFITSPSKYEGGRWKEGK